MTATRTATQTEPSLYQALAPHIETKKHIVWDFNGTILDDVHHTVAVVNTLLEEHKLPLITVEDYRRIFEFPVINYYISLGFDFNKESFESLCDRYSQRFMGGFRQQSRLMPEIELTLQAVKQNKEAQSVLSAAEQRSLFEVIQHHNIENYFDHIFGIDSHYADSKIARGHQLLEQSGYDARDTVIIGDTIHDLEVGQSLGAEVVLVARGHQCATRLKKVHSKVVEVL